MKKPSYLFARHPVLVGVGGIGAGVIIAASAASTALIPLIDSTRHSVMRGAHPEVCNGTRTLTTMLIDLKRRERASEGDGNHPRRLTATLCESSI
jgi:hypothetical protein